MISWWWLLVEAGILIPVAVMWRFGARQAALHDAFNRPAAARAEFLRRSGVKVKKEYPRQWL